VEPCHTRDGRLIGFRLIRNQPSREWLLEADHLTRRYGGVLHRFDVALDMARPGRRDLLATTAVLKWSAKGRVHDTDPADGTTHWGPKRSRRNLALYDDTGADCIISNCA
jgi:hypothetical protein